MPTPDDDDAERTRRFHELTRSGPCSADELLPLVYDELRAIARARVAREAPGATLQPTMLVHEAWLRLVGEDDPGWSGRGHFIGAAARAMRRILVDRARRKARLRHGGGRQREDLADDAVQAPTPDDRLLAVDEALRRLEAEDPRKGRIVELRWFVGFSSQETADALDVSLGTVEREWRFIRSWLRSELGDGDGRKKPERVQGPDDGRRTEG